MTLHDTFGNMAWIWMLTNNTDGYDYPWANQKRERVLAPSSFCQQTNFHRFIDFSFFERLRSPASSGPLQTPSYLSYRHSDQMVCLPRKPPPLCRRRDVALVKPKQRQRRPFVPSPGPPERLHAVQQRLQQILLHLPLILMLILTRSALLSSRFL